MRFATQLDQAMRRNRSSLCVGLDVDLGLIPGKFLEAEDPIFAFNQELITMTKDHVCAYKPNSAFYEMHGIAGLKALLKTIEFIREIGLPVILDAKRGDIGNSSTAYARAAFEVFKADAVTVNPYMGHDSVRPFIEHQDKGVFILCLTSNNGSRDFQAREEGAPLFLSVAKKVKEWDQYGNCGLVVGATRADDLKNIHELVGDMPILIPGVGTQGGDLEKAVKFGGARAVINASRSIIYSADPGAEACKVKEEINRCRA